MRLDRAVHHRKTEARSARLRREEWIEEAVADLRRNTRAVVRYAHGDRAVLEENAGRQRLEAPQRDLDAHLAASWRGLDRVERQVEHGAVEEVGVSFDDQRHLVTDRAAY